jgi:UDP-N-acetylmuramoyl-L-alanyl-D-glutamate--2,6-diaminopimelate ligase
MELARLIAAIEPTDVVNPAACEIADLAYDTRALSTGALFFCVPGAKVDGHDLAAAAVAGGAVALVVERHLGASVPQLVVPSVRTAMPPAANAFFETPSRELEVAAVTGTNGKTTTAFLLRAVLDAAGRRPGLLTNIERRVGGESCSIGLNTPEAIDLQRLLRAMVDAGDGSCAMEATSIAASQGRLLGTRFAVLVFTNLTQDHLDFHGTMDEYFAAKRGLFAQAERAVVNVGDDWGRRLAAELPHVRTFTPDDDLPDIGLRLAGRFNKANALGAVWAARELGIDEAAIRAGIASVAAVPGRFETVEEGQPFQVIVDYAHTPDSLANILEAARGLGSGRLFVVFGAGGDRDREKRAVMGEIAGALADRAIVTTDNPRSEDPAAIAKQVAAGSLQIVLDRRKAIETAIAEALPGDVVVIAGKGADREMEIAGGRIPFDDRDVARTALRRAGAAA